MSFAEDTQRLSLLNKWEDKCWGKTRLVPNDAFLEVKAIKEVVDKWGNNCLVHELQVEKGGYCSIHWHWKWNRFVIDDACIQIEIWQIRDTWLSDGDAYDARGADNVFVLNGQKSGPKILDVETGVVHRFTVLESGRVWEAYWPGKPSSGVDLDDIIRFKEGGVLFC